MSSGRLIAVVGPSGVGKDSVMAGIASALPEVKLVRRVITRAAELGGEDYEAVTSEAFERMAQDGAFCVHWNAHGLRYGIPARVLADVEAGTDCLVNFSRSALLDASRHFPRFLVLNITAYSEVLAQRLIARGRENAEEITRRLSKADKPLPEGLDVITVPNNGPLQDAVDLAVRALCAQKADA